MWWRINILFAIAILAGVMHSCKKSNPKILTPIPTPVPDTFDTYDMAGMHNWEGNAHYFKNIHIPEDSVVAVNYSFPILVIDNKTIIDGSEPDTAKRDELYYYGANDSEIIFYVNKDFTHPGFDSLDDCAIVHNFKTNKITYYRTFGSKRYFRQTILVAVD